MTDLIAARSQMALSLAFHIIFAVAGMGMPLLMVLSERRWLKTRDEIYLTLTKRWATGTAILFAVGAVSGTVLSFELGLLWPEFMRMAGPVIGLPFSMEGFAFFFEAIFLGIYLYGWNRISGSFHWWAGVGVMISGTLSGAFVVCANAWMNSPAGFDYIDGKFVNIDPVAAMFNPMAFQQALHMVLAAFLTLSVAVCGIHAWRLLKQPDNAFHQAALRIAVPVAMVTAILQPLSGDISAKAVAEYQPIKFAAMEAQFETYRGAPLRIGGWPDTEAEETHWDIEIPYLASILAFGDPNAEIKGLKAFPKEHWPPVAPVHLAFQVMVGCGMLMLMVYGMYAYRWWKTKSLPLNPVLLKALVLVGPLGIIALQAGWIVTEVGRQPWIIYEIMKVKDAVTPMPGLTIPFALFMGLYAVLGWVVIIALKRHIQLAEQEVVTEPES